MQFSHLPVMLNECIDALNIKPNGLYVDCTLGGAGHSFEIAKRLTDGGKLIGIDRDEEALEAAGERLAPFFDRVELVHSNFCDVDAVLGSRKADGVLIDLGVSSHQLDTAERGFSYINDAPLDMRMNRADPVTASDIVNSYSREQLIKIFYDYGEEKFAPKVADAIIASRSKKAIETTLELAELVRSSVPRPKDGGHPAKRVFQAIRIEVNNELGIIEPTILKLADLLNAGGRLAVITFHSLEDRITKHTFASLANPCTCPKDFPVCICGKKPSVKLISKKPITSTAEELKNNSRAHSAKLRVAEKI